ncbi:MAG: multifunctional CCA addition/repair protein [Betaproteobacteria bacterium]|nr:multifunctional CCA addition/repair protein [Betaproteobacteria bacterium]NBT11400.1 multifunctional CCA addition/repair protein [Betaproteobacteria bacterium]NBU50180.1 multifunctional CCA addition/repair protein [Betaproteobacteria bacterium]NBX95722.1 multifunctional CCA addition/repair protein [Betaproteobacteria bacterium]
MASAETTPSSWRVYLVGGAVRDRLMGLAPGDRDWVVVGARADDLARAGYVPVGRDFPVFLHPQTREEVALARTERKTARGYHGFEFHADPSVTLEEDLRRRDLTINAIAQDESGSLIDPCGGQADLQSKTLRHVSAAFAEDPVRILRLARFAARWPDFTVADETLALCQRMAEEGEVDALVAERVWQELSRGLMEVRPSRMFEVLRACGALQRLMPEVDRLWGVPQRAEHHPEVDTGVHLMMVLDATAAEQASLAVRFAALCHDLGKGTTPQGEWPRHIGHEHRSVKLLEQLSQRLRVPQDCRELAEVVAREHGHLHGSLDFTPAATIRLLDRLDAWRRPERLPLIVQACRCDARGRLGRHAWPYPQGERLLEAYRLASSVDTAAVARQATESGARGPDIGRHIHEARVRALSATGPVWN